MFDWNKTPLAQLGTKSLIFDDPRTRGTWAPHGTVPMRMILVPQQLTSAHL
jgi:hypothetical protein